MKVENTIFIRTRMFGRFCFIVVPFLVGYGFPFSGESKFIFWTVALISYLGYEIFMERKEGNGKVFSDSCLISSIATFGITFGISNIGCIGAENFLFADNSFQDIDYFWINQAMSLIFASSIIMWFGYDSYIGRAASNRLWESRFIDNFLKKTYRVRWPIIWFCLLVSILSRFIQVSLGVFGYSGEIDQLYAMASYRQYLDIGVSLSRVGLVAVSLAYFSGEDRSSRVKYAIALFLIIEIVIGFLSGFKGQTVMPLIIVGVCQYLATGKIPRWNIAAAIIVLYFSYVIIEPFRILRYSDEYFDGRDIVAIGSAMMAIGGDSDNFALQGKSHWRSVIVRSGLTVEAARSIRFKEENGIPEGAPQFLRNMLISPIYAFVPRLVWGGKPFGNLGQWYGQAIYQETTENNSIGMSPVGYLYFAGGVVGVLVGFYVIGATIRIFCGSNILSGSGGMFVFIGMLSVVMFVDSAVDSMFSSVFRFFPLFLLGQRLIFVS